MLSVIIMAIGIKIKSHKGEGVTNILLNSNKDTVAPATNTSVHGLVALIKAP